MSEKIKSEFGSELLNVKIEENDVDDYTEKFLDSDIDIKVCTYYCPLSKHV